jgi:hypothetical protein
MKYKFDKSNEIRGGGLDVRRKKREITWSKLLKLPIIDIAIKIGFTKTYLFAILRFPGGFACNTWLNPARIYIFF